MTLLHFALASGAIALGIILFAHPLILRGRSRLLRGTVIWFALVLLLRALDIAFMR